jgi:hypothetical protein
MNLDARIKQLQEELEKLKSIRNSLETGFKASKSSVIYLPWNIYYAYQGMFDSKETVPTYKGKTVKKS